MSFFFFISLTKLTLHISGSHLIHLLLLSWTLIMIVFSASVSIPQLTRSSCVLNRLAILGETALRVWMMARLTYLTTTLMYSRASSLFSSVSSLWDVNPSNRYAI